MQEFKAGPYQRVFATGGPIEGQGGYINDYHTTASVGADLLKKDGIPGASLQMVPSRVSNRNRIYYSAVALRDWFLEHNLHVDSINVLTEGAHARRRGCFFRRHSERMSRSASSPFPTRIMTPGIGGVIVMECARFRVKPWPMFTRSSSSGRRQSRTALPTCFTWKRAIKTTKHSKYPNAEHELRLRQAEKNQGQLSQ